MPTQADGAPRRLWWLRERRSIGVLLIVCWPVVTYLALLVAVGVPGWAGVVVGLGLGACVLGAGLVLVNGPGRARTWWVALAATVSVWALSVLLPLWALTWLAGDTSSSEPEPDGPCREETLRMLSGAQPIATPGSAWEPADFAGYCEVEALVTSTTRAVDDLRRWLEDQGYRAYARPGEGDWTEVHGYRVGTVDVVVDVWPRTEGPGSILISVPEAAVVGE